MATTESDSDDDEECSSPFIFGLGSFRELLWDWPVCAYPNITISVGLHEGSTVQYLLDNHPSMMDDGLTRHQSRAHMVRTFLEGPHKQVKGNRARLKKERINPKYPPFTFSGWKKVLTPYLDKSLDGWDEQFLIDFLQVGRNLGEYRAKGKKEADVDVLSAAHDTFVSCCNKSIPLVFISEIYLD